MVEVFKTNVNDRNQAEMLAGMIHTLFEGYVANFDLEDCDCILRVKSEKERIHGQVLVQLLNRFGFHAEVLPDTVPAGQISEVPVRQPDFN